MSDVDPAEVSVRARSLRAEDFVPDTDEPASEPVISKKPERDKAEREGLPPGYRMRADPHYVEDLTSRRPERVDSAGAPGAVESRAERLHVELAECLATIETAASALGRDAGRMGRRVNTDLIRSHASRAAWALRAHGLSASADRVRSRPRPLGFLLDRIRNAWAAECRLEGFTLQVRASDWNAVVAVDEEAVITGVGGALVATLGLVGETDGAALTLSAVATSGALQSVDLVQDEVYVTPGDGARFFDTFWGDRPGGWMAGLGAAAAKAAAQRHGGDAIFLTDEDRGSTVRLQFAR